MVPVTLIIYCCTVLFLLNSGILFLLPLFFKSKNDYDIVKNLIFGNVLQIITGLWGLFLFVMILFFPLTNIIIFGDLIPALALLLVSTTFLFGYIRLSRYLDKSVVQRGASILENIQIPLGAVSMAIGVLHIFLGKILFL